MRATGAAARPVQRESRPGASLSLTCAGRALARGLGFVGLVCAAVAELAWLSGWGAMRRPHEQALWLQRLCRRLARLLVLHVSCRGEPAKSGVLVFNHVSYLDVVVLAAQHPMLFVAKREVRSWPVIGWLAACAGTIFIDRSRRADVARVSALMTAAIAQGVQVCIFPEGTSSDGSRVLPFRTSLLEPVVAGAWPVTAGWVGYALEDGHAELEVCYWGEMSFAPHFLRLLTKRRIFVNVAYAPLTNHRACRKQLGRELHTVVLNLSAQPA